MDNFNEEDIKAIRELIDNKKELKEVAEDRRALSRFVSRTKMTFAFIITGVAALTLIGDKIAVWIKGLFQ